MSNNFNVYFVYLWSSVVDCFMTSFVSVAYTAFPDVYIGSEITMCQTLLCSINNVGDLGSIPGLGRSPGGGHGSPLQYSCLENPQWQRSGVGALGSQTVGPGWVTKHRQQQTAAPAHPPPPVQRKHQQVSGRNTLWLLHWSGRASLLLGFQTACLQMYTHRWQQSVLLQFNDLCVHAGRHSSNKQRVHHLHS